MQRVQTTVIAVVGAQARALVEAVGGDANAKAVVPSPGAEPLDRAVEAWTTIRRTRTPFALHDADPLADVADAWVAYYDESAPRGDLEVVVAATVQRWRGRQPRVARPVRGDRGGGHACDAPPLLARVPARGRTRARGARAPGAGCGPAGRRPAARKALVARPRPPPRRDRARRARPRGPGAGAGRLTRPAHALVGAPTSSGGRAAAIGSRSWGPATSRACWVTRTIRWSGKRPSSSAS